MECVACGRWIINDETAVNCAAWTLTPIQLPYCADSADCQRDAEQQASR